MFNGSFLRVVISRPTPSRCQRRRPPTQRTVQPRRKRVVHLDTPQVPHNWEARVLFEEATGTLLCGDLFTHLGNHDPLTTEDIVGRAIEFE